MRYEARLSILTDNEGLYPYRQDMLRVFQLFLVWPRPWTRAGLIRGLRRPSETWGPRNATAVAPFYAEEFWVPAQGRNDEGRGFRRGEGVIAG